jgi:hypothetical protein
MSLSTPLLVAACICSIAASNILIRPDREDQQYLDLGARYPASVCLNLPDGEGVLIDAQWLLTAAHLAKDIKIGDEAHPIRIGEHEYRPEQVVVHPKWKSADQGHDLALVRLDRPVTGVAPVPIYHGHAEVGLVATMVGHGYSGTLETGPVSKDKWDHKKRGATNKIEKVIQKKWLMFLVDRPDSATDLEGTSGPGDSGNPAFVELDGKTYVAGIGSFTDDTTNDQIVGNYGDREAFGRVSVDAAWIDKTIGATGKPAASPGVGDPQRQP